MNSLIVAGTVAGALVLVLCTVLCLRVLQRRGRQKKAATRLQWGDLKGAANLFREAGDLGRAASLYAQSGERLLACEMQLKLKNPDAAVEALRGASPVDLEKGAALLEKSRALEERSRAKALAAIARGASLFRLAAELYEKAGNLDELRACRQQEARALAAQGKQLEAAAIYERLGDQRAAAAAQAEAARREADPRKKRELARKASALLSQLGEMTEAAEALAIGGDIDGGVELLLGASNLAGAAQLLLWHGHHARAGELFEKAGDLKSAARAWGRAGEARRASAALEKAGDSVGAAKWLLDAKDPKAAAQVHLRAGAPAAAAELLAGAGDVDGAVRAFLDANALDEAVQLLCKHARQRDAAALLEAKGEHDRAAVLLAESGDLLQRARLLATRRDYEGAAQAYLDLGQPEEAKAVLAQASLLGPGGRFLLARACMASSAFDEAAGHFSALLEGAPSAHVPRLDALYGLARCFEALGRLAEATTAFQEVCRLDEKYRDASLRVRLLQARMTSPPPAAPVTPIQLVNGIPPEAAAGEPGAPQHPLGVPPRYVVERELGRGAMGVVYRALDSQLGRTVAIKVLEAHAGANPRLREYFLREARAVAQLVHSNIVTLFDAGLEGSAPYLVMELVEGADLRTRLQDGPMAVGEALRLIAAIASALDYAHARKIVHRDVKPENILVGSDGTPKLMDFGVAHTVRDTDDRRATVIGTPVYMAPEQIKGEGIGGWTDTYALGAVLYETLTGQPPFDPKGALYHHSNTPAPDPRLLRPELSEPVAQAVLGCLAKRPEERPASARVLSETLLRLAETSAAA